jgi:hypothetical protein
MLQLKGHITYNLYYCAFDINPLKDNKRTSKTRLLQWAKKCNMDNLTLYETSGNPIWIAKSNMCPLKMQTIFYYFDFLWTHT